MNKPKQAISNIVTTVAKSLGVLLIAMASVSFAQAPQLTGLFPAGGQRGTTVEVTLSGTFPTWPVKIRCDQGDCVFAASETSGKLNITIAPDAKPGVRWLRIYDDKGASGMRPFVVGMIAEVIESKDNGKTLEAEPVTALPVTINGVLEKQSNVDTYVVTLKRGESLVASLDANRGPKSPLDATLQILNPAGIVLEQNLDCHGLDPQIVFKAPNDGTYQVRVFGFPETPDSTIAYAAGPLLIYRLTLTTGPYVEAAIPLAVSSVQPTEIQLVGYNFSESVKVVAPPEAIQQQHYSLTHTTAVGHLSLPIKACPIVLEQPSNESTGKQSILIPSCITGCIQNTKEKDAFVFEAKAKSRWKFRLESRSLGYPMDGLLTLLDAQEKQLVKQDDSGALPDPTIAWQCPADGTYSIVVSDLYGQASDLHIYRLTIEEDDATAQLTVPNDLISGKVGQPIEVAVKVQRLLDYADELTIMADGVPASITVTPAQSTAGNDSAKSVKLVLQSGEPFQGPIRIIAQPKAKPEEKLFVTATDSNQTTLWLSINPM